MTVSSRHQGQENQHRLVLLLATLVVTFVVLLGWLVSNDRAPRIVQDAGTLVAAAPVYDETAQKVTEAYMNAGGTTYAPPILSPDSFEATTLNSKLKAARLNATWSKEFVQTKLHNYVSYRPVARKGAVVTIEIDGVRLNVPADRFIRNTSKVALKYEKPRFSEMFLPDGSRKPITPELLLRHVDFEKIDFA